MSELYGSKHFAYGKSDKNQIRRKNFISGVQSQRGVHSSEIKIEWNKSKNWLNLLVSAEKHRRKEIIFSYLKLGSYKDVDSLDDAFEQLDPYINNVSERALIDYFEKNKVVHEAVEAMAKQRNYGLMISQLGWEILNWERKMLKKNSCPEMFFTPARLILFRVECEDDNHRKDCIQYHMDAKNAWADTGSRIGVGRKEFGADNVEMRNIKLRVQGDLIVRLLKENDWETVKKFLASTNWDAPDIWTNPKWQPILKLTKEEKAFVAEYFNIYDVEVLESGAVITSMREVYDEDSSEYV